MITGIKAKVKMYGLVRDKAGKPKIDGDPRDLHPSIREELSVGEFEVACDEWDRKVQEQKG